MLEVDLHSHTLFSQCGIHTVIEMLTYAKSIGLKALAVTDHGPAMKGCRLNSPFFLRLNNPVPGIMLIKGAELNIINDQGKTDCPMRYLPFMDIVLAGLHQNIKKGLNKKKYTNMLINAIIKNNFIDIITHPNNPDYLPDMKLVIEACKEHDKVIEINNSKTDLEKVDNNITLELINLCKEYECNVAVNSDAHALHEIGNNNAVEPLLEQADFPDKLIVNRNLKTAINYIERRKVYKKN
ncbi:MAG: PHP domain-containing protein [Spirochaetes bacterium]|nr:PHP domain-containing protein [Spirochaetota bacterium]